MDKTTRILIITLGSLSIIIILALVSATTSTTGINSSTNTFITNNSSGIAIPSNTSFSSSHTNSTPTPNVAAAAISSNQPKIKVVASFYPMYEFVKQVGGDRVDVSTLIPIGIEPHDYDPTIQQILNAQSASMLVFNSPGLETWVPKVNAKFALDASNGITLRSSTDPNSHGTDPHVWLDPILTKKEVENIRDGLIKVDPVNAAYYAATAKKFTGQLDSLDTSIRTMLPTCQKKDFIAFHEAFGYFAKRYGLNQHSVLGISPEGEIAPQKLQEVVQLARDLGINTIYSEDLVDPRLANTIAQEIPNGKVVILSPIEGINRSEQKAGITYIDKMHQDIAALKGGLVCK
jgi:zinc transport system substrate-binding protein